jgi:hypothetical protein
MRVVRHSDASAFLHQAGPFLLEDETAHNLILGITGRFVASGKTPEDVYLVHVEDESGQVLAAAMRTPPYAMVLSLVGDRAAIPLLAEHVAGVFDALSGVGGAPEDAELFADLWEGRSHQPYYLYMQQGVYKLETVVPVEGVTGEYRPATRDECDLLIEWVYAFGREALAEEQPRADIEKLITRKLSGDVTDVIRLWWDKGAPVSMAASSGPTPHGIRINLVYTPPEKRGHGYASAVTAAITQEMLDSGRKFCFLFTDLSNPTSNHIYQNIGYQHVCTQHHYRFRDPV